MMMLVDTVVKVIEAQRCLSRQASIRPRGAATPLGLLSFAVLARWYGPTAPTGTTGP